MLNRALPGPGGKSPDFDVLGELGFIERSDVPAMCDYVAMMEERLGAAIRSRTQLLSSGRSGTCARHLVLIRSQTQVVRLSSCSVEGVRGGFEDDISGICQ